MSANAVRGGIAGRAWLAYAWSRARWWRLGVSRFGRARFPDTLVYCVRALTMIPPALFVLCAGLDAAVRRRLFYACLSPAGRRRTDVRSCLTVGPATSSSRSSRSRGGPSHFVRLLATHGRIGPRASCSLVALRCRPVLRRRPDAWAGSPRAAIMGLGVRPIHEAGNPRQRRKQLLLMMVARGLMPVPCL